MSTNTTITERTIKILGVNGHDTPGGTDKVSVHSYGEMYDELLIENPPKSILEIGVQYGGSLLLWKALAPEAFILGVDVSDQIHPSIKHRCPEVLVGDAYSEETWNRVRRLTPDGGWNLIIDDGPHTLDSQVQALKLYAPLLSRRGTLVIEDVQSVEDFKVLQEHVPTDFIFQTRDLRSVKGRWDDLVFEVYRL